MKVEDLAIHDFLAALSAPAVAPAGISGIALSCAAGAALILKVARITEQKLKPGPRLEKAAMVASKAERLRNMFEDVAGQDAVAYQKLVSIHSAYAKGLENAENLERARKTVTLIPGAMGRAAMICVNLASELVEVAHRPALLDLAMGTLLCYAGVEASLMVVKNNVAEVADPDFREKVLSKLDFFDNRAATVERIVATAMERRQSR